MTPTPAAEPEAPARPALPGEVASEPFRPLPVEIHLEDLPAPFATDSVRRSPQRVERPDGAKLRVPPGFRVQLFREGLNNARWLARTPDGRVLVACSRDNRIVALTDADSNGVAEHAEELVTERQGLDLPFGMIFTDEHFYVGNQAYVLRFGWRRGQRRLRRPGRPIMELPGGGYRQHWTRNLLLAPDGEHAYLSIGSQSNVDPERSPRATIQVVDLATGRMRTFASGLRNPVGLALHPTTGALYATVNERDHLGDDLVPDYLTQVEEGAFYGWPYAYLSPELLDPRRMRRGARSERPDLARRTRTPEVLFQAHSAALGLAFYGGTAFPAKYRGGAFVAFRGSWNRSQGTGYQIVFVPFSEQGQALGYYEPFVDGFLVRPTIPTTWGRPVGVLVLPDGSLLFTEESGGRVYRVSYVGEG
ncbi:MAG: PQQ-dependent sugar dehydrogenase [Sandaracinaceae bacterium]